MCLGLLKLRLYHKLLGRYTPVSPCEKNSECTLFFRATTYYLADRRYDMLPSVLSADICSLLSGLDR